MADGEETEEVRSMRPAGRGLDAIDRKISGALAGDATLSYATLSERVGLSAAAIHERVRRLRASGAIRSTTADLDGAAMGKPMLAFVHVETTGWGKTRALTELADLPELEEIHSATGDACIILKVRVASSDALEGFLSRVYDLQGVQRTRTFLALSTYLERGVQAGVTEALAAEDHIRD
ncbi:Lrp/AsnC family transcriptional regulator [uncultured Jannaschia sp.]|uniref:Lrp/AsnC family transcriptional regulator n=1 Tax=uncultured Jannaschia sp. TaxID=293347 RepID=UPI00260FFF50|nr:Lrp/AsnC family transcriptional regulator [uncultured Jannaschia sp.]